MEPKESNEMNVFQILVKETRDHHTIEWSGNLTLVTEENGVEFLEISFADQADLRSSQHKYADSNNTFLSVEYIKTEDLQEVRA
jgi:hypothetical protein